MSYVLQHPDFGLGNFINITPAISWLRRTTGQPVPVYFSTDYVRECFTDWKDIEILDRQPEGGMWFGSHVVNPDNDLPDYKYAFRVVTGEHWTPNFPTYVDRPMMTRREKEDFSDCIVIVNGAGNDNLAYVATKDPGIAAFVDAVAGATLKHPRAKVVAIGSLADFWRNTWMKDVADECYTGNIRTALKIISRAKVVIANDTGLAHAAGAMNKNLTVLMKNTPRERVKNAGKNTNYIYL